MSKQSAQKHKKEKLILLTAVKDIKIQYHVYF